MPINPAWVRSMCEANGTECEFFDCDTTATQLYSTARVAVLLCDEHHHLVLNPPRPAGYEKYLGDYMHGLMQRKSWVYMNAISDGYLELIVQEKNLEETQQGIRQRAAQRELKKKIKRDVASSGIKPGMPDVEIVRRRAGRKSSDPAERLLSDAFYVPPAQPKEVPLPTVPSAEIVEGIKTDKPVVEAPRQAGAPAAESDFDADFLFD